MSSAQHAFGSSCSLNRMPAMPVVLASVRIFQEVLRCLSCNLRIRMSPPDSPSMNFASHLTACSTRRTKKRSFGLFLAFVSFFCASFCTSLIAAHKCAVKGRTLGTMPVTHDIRPVKLLNSSTFAMPFLSRKIFACSFSVSNLLAVMPMATASLFKMNWTPIHSTFLPIWALWACIFAPSASQRSSTRAAILFR